MKRASKFITLLLIFAIMFVVGGSLVITYPDEYTIVRQFGEIVRVTDTAGVSLKLPVIQTSSTLPKSLQLYDIPESDVITRQKQNRQASISQLPYCLQVTSISPIMFRTPTTGPVISAVYWMMESARRLRMRISLW